MYRPGTTTCAHKATEERTIMTQFSHTSPTGPEIVFLETRAGMQTVEPQLYKPSQHNGRGVGVWNLP